jgi:hypothetical protein
MRHLPIGAVGAGCSCRARCVVLDLVFVGVTVLFFAVSVGYVAACERLMK